MNEEWMVLMSDDDGHWFIMPESEVEGFTRAVEMAGIDYGRSAQEYWQYAINGDPYGLKFKEWERDY